MIFEYLKVFSLIYIHFNTANIDAINFNKFFSFHFFLFFSLMISHFWFHRPQIMVQRFFYVSPLQMNNFQNSIQPKNIALFMFVS